MTTQPSYKRHFYIPSGNIIPGSNQMDSSSRSIFGTLEQRRRLMSELNVAKSAGDTVGVKMIETELGITDTTRPSDDSKKMVHDMLNTIKTRLLDPNLSANEAFNMYSKLATLEKVLAGEKIDLSTISSLNVQTPASPAPLTMISQTSELYNLINQIEKRQEEKMVKFAPEDPLEKMKRDAEFFKMMGWKSPDETSRMGSDSNIELKKIDNEFELAKMKLDSEGKKYTGIKEIITDVITAVAEESGGDDFAERKDKKVIRSNRPAFNCLGEKCGQRVEFSHPESSRDITCPTCNTKHHYDHMKKDNQITLV